MRAQRSALGATIGVILIINFACTGNISPVESLDERVGTHDLLVATLQANGIKVEAAGVVSQPFFEPEGQVIRLADQEIQVFEFVTESDAASAAETISPDGSSIGTSMVSWIAPPHFYHAGKLVVLYVGDEQSIVTALEGVLGPQISGR